MKPPFGSGGAAAFRFLAYGTDETTARPNADVVYWVGDVGAGLPENGEAHDLVFIPEA